MSVIERANLTIEDLLPHRGAMLLIEEVLEVDAVRARTLSTVRLNWPLTDERGAESLICVELAAQTAGVCNGWDRIHSKGLDSDKTGWLVGIKKAEFHLQLLPYGAEILCRAENINDFENLREVSCQQLLDGRLIGSMILQLYQE